MIVREIGVSFAIFYICKLGKDKRMRSNYLDLYNGGLESDTKLGGGGEMYRINRSISE